MSTAEVERRQLARLQDPNLQESLLEVHAIAGEHGVSHSAVLLLDAASRELSLLSQQGWPRDDSAVRIPLRQPFQNGAELRYYIPGPEGNGAYVFGGSQLTRSGLSVPLMIKGELVAFLDLQSEQVNFFDAKLVELARRLANQTSLALHLQRAEALEAKRTEHFEAISAIARQTTAALTDLNELLARFCALLLEHFPLDHVGVFLLKNEELVLRSHCGRLFLAAPQGLDTSVQPVGLCLRALEAEDSIYAEYCADEPDYVGWLTGVHSELCFPLISLGQPVGALSLCSSRPRAFAALDLQSLACVADICASAIGNATQFHQVRDFAYRDGLTGVFNRRFFEVRLVGELERAQRYRSPLSLLVIDVDKFKLLNDRYGHQLGDQALRQIAAIFEQQLRKADIVCRYGGDEFAVLLPEIGDEKACAVAERLRGAIAAMDVGEVACPVSLSIGVAACPKHAKSGDELVHAADQALYRAKQAGRNRVVLHQDAKSA